MSRSPQTPNALRPARQAVASRSRSDPPDDPVELVHRFQAGDSDMLAPLIAHFSPAMRAVARRHLDLRHDIDDAVQDAWLQFTRGARLIRSPGAAGGWLCVTTKHAALTIARRRGRTVSLSCDFDLPAPQQPDGAVLREERTAVCAAIGRLPASERALVEMLFVARLPYEEVMERTGRPVGAIGPTRQRVLQKLRHDPAIRALAASL